MAIVCWNRFRDQRLQLIKYSWRSFQCKTNSSAKNELQNAGAPIEAFFGHRTEQAEHDQQGCKRASRGDHPDRHALYPVPLGTVGRVLWCSDFNSADRRLQFTGIGGRDVIDQMLTRVST